VALTALVGRLQKKGRLDWRSTLGKNAPSVGDVIEGWQ
jgi:HTH-type transcriptional regulator/antitoxin HigA